MKTITFKISLITIIFILSCDYIVFGQCVNISNVYPFVYNGKNYEVIKENKTWINAAACAVERGGMLTEINDLAEQNAIFNELASNAGINTNNTVAPDGGGASYVWIGGNDLTDEGDWVWDGDNDNNGTQFWMGDFKGNPVGGLYNNWGNEPDNYGAGQNGLGLALTNWPFGNAGQWNDISHANTLYYVIEYSTILSTEDLGFNTKIKLFPNPVVDFVTIETNGIDIREIVILNSSGQTSKTINVKGGLSSKKIDLSNLNNGIYFINIRSQNGESIIEKIIKNN